MSKKQSSPLLNRRQFGLVGLTSGLGLLLGGNAMAQVKGGAKKGVKGHQAKGEAQRMSEEHMPSLHGSPHVNLKSALLGAEVVLKAKGEKLIVELYAVNTSKHDYKLVDTRSDASVHKVDIKIRSRNFSGEMVAESPSRFSMSRRMYTGYRDIVAAKDGQPTRVLLDTLEAQWPEALVKQTRDYAGEEATLSFSTSFKVANAKETTVSPIASQEIILPKMRQS